jgi:hypothetical protein
MGVYRIVFSNNTAIEAQPSDRSLEGGDYEFAFIADERIRIPVSLYILASDEENALRRGKKILREVQLIPN